MKDLIDKNLRYLSELTKEESDFISNILSWDDEQKIAFSLAKRIFEEDSDDDES